MTTRDGDPFSAFNFIVEISGVEVSDFIIADLPKISAQPMRVREGDDRRLSARRLMGSVEIGDLKLTRGYDGNPNLWRWFETVAGGEDERRTISVILLDRRRQEVARWNFFNAWPSMYEGPTLDAGSNDIAIETITIACESVELAT